MYSVFAHTQEVTGLTVDSVLATLVYALMGIVILVVTIVLVNAMFRLNLKKELVEDNNTAFGVLIAGLAIGISIIIAGTIAS